jgi:hypothetical protein
VSDSSVLSEYLSQLFGALSSRLECPLPLLLAAVASDLFSGRDDKVRAHILCELVVLTHVHLRVEVEHEVLLVIEPTRPLLVRRVGEGGQPHQLILEPEEPLQGGLLIGTAQSLMLRMVLEVLFEFSQGELVFKEVVEVNRDSRVGLVSQVVLDDAV